MADDEQVVIPRDDQDEAPTPDVGGPDGSAGPEAPDDVAGADHADTIDANDVTPTRKPGHRPAHGQEDALRIEELLKSGSKPKEICALLPHFSRTNIYLRCQRFKQTGTSLTDPANFLPSGRQAIIDAGATQCIKGVLAVKPDIELAELSELLKKDEGIETSRASISRAIAGILGGPRVRGLKSRRLGVKKRERMEQEGLLQDGQSWQGRTGVVYEKGADHEKMVDETRVREGSGRQSLGATPESIERRSSTFLGASTKKRKRTSAVGAADQTQSQLDPRLQATGDAEPSTDAPAPEPTEMTSKDREMVNAIYAYQSLPIYGNG